MFICLSRSFSVMILGSAEYDFSFRSLSVFVNQKAEWSQRLCACLPLSDREVLCPCQSLLAVVSAVSVFLVAPVLPPPLLPWPSTSLTLSISTIDYTTHSTRDHTHFSVFWCERRDQASLSTLTVSPTLGQNETLDMFSLRLLKHSCCEIYWNWIKCVQERETGTDRAGGNERGRGVCGFGWDKKRDGWSGIWLKDSGRRNTWCSEVSQRNWSSLRAYALVR
jgi:hypothetical protein